MRLTKMDLVDEKIERKGFLRAVCEGARVEAMAKEMIGRYTTVTVKALEDMLNKMKAEDKKTKEDQ